MLGRYPYSFVGLGPILSSAIMIVTCVLSYISATYMVEAISMANSQDDGRRRDSLFNEGCYKTPQLQRRANDKDGDVKESEFFVRQKLELGVIADRLADWWLKYVIMGILIVYMYGAMCLKYVSGAESLYRGISFIAYGNAGHLDDVAWVYPVSILFFGFLCIIFSFGDIENSKWLQIFSAYMRIIVLGLMYIGSIYYLGTDGVEAAPVWDWQTQSRSLATVFGNTVFVFIYHHSIPGIMYPIRPQKAVGNMFLVSNVIASILLMGEGILAFMAFSGINHTCSSGEGYPCSVSELYNENFQDIPVLGQICQFYPMLNVSAVPVLVITLRNNFMQVIPVKKWIRQCGCCTFLLDVSPLSPGSSLTARKPLLRCGLAGRLQLLCPRRGLMTSGSSMGTNCVLACVGQPQTGKGHLVDHLLDSCYHHRALREGPAAAHLLHWRYLRALHPLLDPLLAGVVRSPQAGQPQRQEL